MKKGMVKVLRMYMGAEAETVASAAGIPFMRYLDIENCDAEPDESELGKLSAVFGLEEDVFTGEREIDCGFAFRQPLEENVFVSEELREKMRILMTDLTEDEKRLILLIRSAEDSTDLMKRVTDVACEEVF